jgi:hypothetical protein
LTNIGGRLTNLEYGGNYEYVIDEIKAINRYLGIDECYNLYNNEEPKDIIREKNEKFFHYYRTVDYLNNLSSFGMKVQIYHDIYKGNLISIDKKKILYIFGMF